jgi:predicted nucleic acid-binding Zn finger protein
MNTVKVYVYKSRDVVKKYGKFAALEPIDNLDPFTTDFCGESTYMLPAGYYIANDFAGNLAIFKDFEQYGKKVSYLHTLKVVNNAVAIETAPRKYSFLTKGD